MAHIAREEAKDPKPYVAETARCELLELKKSGVISRVRINTRNDSFVCPACREASTRTYGLDEALKTMPIPNLCQSENGCRCWYTAVVDIDEIADRIARRWGSG